MDYIRLASFILVVIGIVWRFSARIKGLQDEIKNRRELDKEKNKNMMQKIDHNYEIFQNHKNDNLIDHTEFKESLAILEKDIAKKLNEQTKEIKSLNLNIARILTRLELND